MAKSTTRAATPKVAAPVCPSNARASRKAILAFRIGTNYRPSAGHALFAHTEAFLIAAGMYEGNAVPRLMLADIIGPTAIQYHTNQGNLEATSSGIQMTERGCNVFGSRKVDPEMLAAMLEILATGDTARDVGGVLPRDWKRGVHAV